MKNDSHITLPEEILFCINLESLTLCVFWEPKLAEYLKIIKHNVVWHFISDDFSPKKILILLLLYIKK